MLMTPHTALTRGPSLYSGSGKTAATGNQDFGYFGGGLSSIFNSDDIKIRLL